MSAALFEPAPFAWRAPPVRGAARAAHGGLVVPDFDAPLPLAEDPAAELLAAAAEAARLETVRAADFAAGEAAGAAREAQSRMARDAAVLAAMALALEQAEAAARSAAIDGSQAVATLLLAALDAALPEAAARLAPEAAARLAAVLLPLLAEGLAVTLHVAAGCGEAAAGRLADPRVKVAEDAALPPGDARATWRGGGACLSLAARRQAVADMLACFQLRKD